MSENMGVKAKITLEDNMSATMAKIGRELGKLTNGMDALANMGTAFDAIADFGGVNDIIAKTGAEIEQLVLGFDNAAKSLSEASDEANMMAYAFDTAGKEGIDAAQTVKALGQATQEAAQEAGFLASIWQGIKGILPMLGIAGIMQAGRMVAGAVNESLSALATQTMAEVQLATVMNNQGNSAEDFGGVIQRAQELSVTTTYGDEALIAGAAELSTYLADPKAVEEAMGTLTNYAAGMAGVEIDARQMTDLATQMGKAFDGTFDGLQKKGFVLTDAQKEALELGDDMERVAVITEVINQSWDGLAEAMAATPQGRMQQLANAAGDIKEAMGNRLVGNVMLLMETLTNLATSQGAQWLTSGFVTAINGVMFVLSILIQGLTWLGDAFATLYNFAAPMFWGLGIILTAIVVPALWAAATAEGGLITKTWALVAAKTAEAGAWISAAIAANMGLLLIVGAIAAVLTAATLMGATFEDILGFIGGLVATLGATIWNAIAQVWNTVIGFTEFLINVFHHPIESINKLFVSLFDNILGVVQDIAKLIDMVFKTDLAGNVADFRQSLKDSLEVMPDGYKVLQKMEAIDLDDAYSAGDNMGRGLANTIEDTLDGIFGLTGAGNNALDMFGGMGDKIESIGTVDEVGRINDDVNIAEEDIRLLRDVAEAQFVQNFVTLRTGITMNGTTIRETADADSIMDKINSRLEMDTAATAKGVYKK